MFAARFEIDKFNGTNNFGLWRIKMKALLVHNEISEAIYEEGIKEIGDDKKKLKMIETKAHSDKLQPKAIKCMFLRYPGGVKGYKLWCLEEGFKKCIVSRDVIFNEKVMAIKPEDKAELSTKTRQLQVKTSIRAITAKAASKDLEIEQMDAKTTLFHEKLDETIYMEMPKGFDEDKDKANLQKVEALSSIEAEYMVAIEVIKKVIWLKGFAKEVGFKTAYITVFCHNQSALHLMKNPMFHERLKHIDIKMHFIRDVISSQEVQVQKIHTNHNPTDMFTKTVTQVKFQPIFYI
uniref:Retroviral polymerase SH3-like domain-containing protein n=1 Tax=Cannabis sativa TaxID=3483 RepID=A0A803PN72_CANSA